MIAAAADLNNNNSNTNNDSAAANHDKELPESGGGGSSEGPVNWQTARCKAEILSHPLYEQLLSAHVSCLRIATPVDQLPRIDAQLAQSQQVVAKYSAIGHGNLGNDRDLEQFMVRINKILSVQFIFLLSMNSLGNGIIPFFLAYCCCILNFGPLFLTTQSILKY